MSKHTPGIWATAQYSPTDIVVDGDGETMIASARDGLNGIAREQAIANARLIAAAPELLSLAIEIESYWSSGNFSRKQDLFEKLCEAIAKATGE